VLVKTAHEFGGVEHRFELVRTLGGVRFYNSSIDSSPTRTVAALSNLSCRQIVICGGRDKHVPFDPLAEALFEKASAVVLTGEAAGQIKDAIGRAAALRPDGGASLTVKEEPDFDEAVRTAARLATPGSAVLLSPACTSFDRFANFAERGDRFKEIVNLLTK
ncbi:MAG: UDP-N-acetylmuramoyl-L-alanine--D-glutamate ligase, partial [Clostridia bacterium]|nr:UDP-N-acetylmuramoyl-L-alanine--D-glutamate ligase [Clostridia bacterium]